MAICMHVLSWTYTFITKNNGECHHKHVIFLWKLQIVNNELGIRSHLNPLFSELMNNLKLISDNVVTAMVILYKAIKKEVITWENIENGQTLPIRA